MTNPPLPTGWTYADEEPSATNPPLPTGWTYAEPETVGTIRGTFNSAKRGGHAALQSLDAVGLVARSNWDRQLAEWENSPNPKLRERARKNRELIREQTPQIIQDIAGRQAKIEALPQAPGKEAFDQAEGAWAKLVEAGKSPIQAIAGLSAESIPASAPSIALGALGSAGGPVGTAIGAGTGSYAMEYAGTLIDVIRQEGGDFQKPKTIQAILNDPEKIAAIQAKAAKRGVPVAVMDALSAGLAGRLFRAPAKSLIGKIGQGTAEVGIQGALGGAGEAFGSLAVGDKVDWGAVVAEALGEVGPGSVEIGTGVVRDRLSDTGKNVRESEKTLQAQQKQLIAGQRPAQMFPIGPDGVEASGELNLPRGMARLQTERGVFHYNPRLVSAAKIRELSAAGRENEILGLGPLNKSDVENRAAATGEPIVAITERTPDGVEVKSAVGTPGTAQQQAAALEKQKTPGNTVQVEPAQGVIADRLKEKSGGLDEIMAQVATADAERAKARAEEQAQRVARLEAARQKREAFAGHLEVARETMKNPDATFAQVQGAANVMRFYAEDNSIGLDEESVSRARRGAEALSRRLADMQVREESRREAEAAARKQNSDTEEASKLARIRTDRERINYIERTGRDPDTGRIVELRNVPDDNLQALDPQKEGLTQEQIETEMERRFREEERESAATTSQDYTLRDLFSGKKSAMRAAGLTAPLRLPIPEKTRKKGGLGGELQMLWESNVPSGYFSKTAPSLDRLAETLRGLGFRAETETDVVDLMQRAFNGEQITPTFDNSTEYATASHESDTLTDAGAEREIAALRKAFPELTREYDIETGLVEDLLRARGHDEPVPESAVAAIKRLRGQQTLIVLAARAWRDRAKGAALFTHEMAHAYLDTLPAETRSLLRDLYERETSDHTGPLFDSNGKPNTDIAFLPEQFSSERLRRDPDLAFKEWFAERVAKFNRDWMRGKIDATGHSLLRRLAHQLREFIRRIWSALAGRDGIDANSELFEDAFRRWLTGGADAQTGREAGTAYAIQQRRGESRVDYGKGRDKRGMVKTHPWPKGFPDIIWHGDQTSINAHPEYRAAKSGNVGAAVRLVGAFFEAKKVDGLARRFPNALIVPVHAEEATGRNAIPSAYASMLAEVTGLPVYSEIVQSNHRRATGQSGLYRWARRAEFAGPVEAGRDYIIVDDMRSMGGTLNALRNHIETGGGRVVLASTLGADTKRLPGDRVPLAPRPEVLSELDRRFGLENISRTLNELGIYSDARHLTGPEAYWLSTWRGSLDDFRNRVLASRSKDEGSGSTASDPSGGSPESSDGGVEFATAAGREEGGKSPIDPKSESEKAQEVVDNMAKPPPSARLDALLAELERGQKLRSDGARAQNESAMEEGNRIARWAKGRLDLEFPDWERDAGQRAANPPPTPPATDAASSARPSKVVRDIYGHTSSRPSFLEKSWAALRDILYSFRGAVPELPAFPSAWFRNKEDRFINPNDATDELSTLKKRLLEQAEAIKKRGMPVSGTLKRQLELLDKLTGTGPAFYNRIKELRRTLLAGNDAVQKDADRALKKIVEPLLKAGGARFGAEAYRKLQGLQERKRKLVNAGKPVSADLDTSIADLESRMESQPIVLFQQLLMMLDFQWRAENITLEDGGAPKLPNDMTLPEVRAELARLKQAVAAHPQQGVILDALRAHMDMVKSIADDLKERSLFSADELANPYYFPHVVLTAWEDGKLVEREMRIERIKPDADADFRGYLVTPVGSARNIETDYAKAMYYHLVQVGEHNWKADAVRDFAKFYDVREAAEELAKLRGMSLEHFFNVELAPAGYAKYGAESMDAFTAFEINRAALARRLGVALTSEDLHEQFKKLGVDNVRLNAGDIESVLHQSERETWILPRRVADALRGIHARSSHTEWALNRALKKAQGWWKQWKLMMPQNHARYEYGNMVADAEKIFSSTPGTLRKLPKAMKEIHALWLEKGEISPELKGAIKEGVINTITAQEVNALRTLRAFEQFETVAERVIRELKNRFSSLHYQWFTNFIGLGHLPSWELSAMREAITRYANYLNNLEKLENNARPDYGGSYWRDIDAMQESKPGAGDANIRKAAKISRDTFGDYDNISVGGQYIREHLQAFYSWTEVNFKYHANVLRNLRDMSKAGMFSKTETGRKLAKEMAFRTGSAAASKAGKFIIRLAVPYVLMHAFASIWMGDNEDDLSEEDKRRPHLTTSKRKDGTFFVQYFNTAFADVLRWFGGERFMHAAMSWLTGKTDFATAVEAAEEALSEAPKDFVNNVAGGLSPHLKLPVEVATGKKMFPNVFDMRTIPAYDMKRYILESLTDGFTADMIARVVDKDYYSVRDMGSWVRQLLLQQRLRDPEQFGYYAIRDKADEFAEMKRGRPRGTGAGVGDVRDQLTRNFRRAIYNGDAENAMRFYNRLLEEGYTAESFAASIRSQDPLHAIRKEWRREFVESLDLLGRRQLENAYRHYEKIAASRGREKVLFPTKASGERGQQRYQAAPRTDYLQRLLEASEQLTDDDEVAKANRALQQSLKKR